MKSPVEQTCVRNSTCVARGMHLTLDSYRQGGAKGNKLELAQSLRLQIHCNERSRQLGNQRSEKKVRQTTWNPQRLSSPPGTRLSVASAVLAFSIVLTHNPAIAGETTLDTTRIEGTDSFRAVARFPDDVRNAILELSQYPRVVQTLGEAANLDAEQITQLTREYKEDVRNAATRLASVPEAIDVMAANLEVTTLLGTIYTAHGDAIVEAADRLHEELVTADAKAFLRWSELLDDNEKARDELVAAADDYAAEHSVEAANRASSEFGFEVTPTFEPVFYALPAYQPVRYVLSNANHYPFLADALLTFRRSGPSLVPAYYAINDWWRLWSPYYATEFLRADDDRPHRLREAAQFEKHFASTNEARSREMTRDAFRHSHSSTYQHIAAFQRTTRSERDQDRDRIHSPGDQRSTTAASDRNRSRDERLAKSRALGQQRAKAKGEQRRARIDQRRQLSSTERSSRAAQNMQRAWSMNRQVPGRPSAQRGNRGGSR